MSDTDRGYFLVSTELGTRLVPAGETRTSPDEIEELDGRPRPARRFDWLTRRPEKVGKSAD